MNHQQHLGPSHHHLYTDSICWSVFSILIPWVELSHADGGGPNGRWYISNNKAVEVSDFLCGRGLISSSEHRNLLPVMLEEDSWQYKARCVAVRGKVPICGYPSTKRKLRNGWFVDDFSTWSKKDLTSYSHHDSTHWGPVWMEQRFADLLFHYSTCSTRATLHFLSVFWQKWPCDL